MVCEILNKSQLVINSLKFHRNKFYFIVKNYLFALNLTALINFNTFKIWRFDILNRHLKLNKCDMEMMTVEKCEIIIELRNSRNISKFSSVVVCVCVCVCVCCVCVCVCVCVCCARGCNWWSLLKAVFYASASFFMEVSGNYLFDFYSNVFKE